VVIEMTAKPGRTSMPVLATLMLAQFSGCATYSRVGESYRHGRTRLEVKLPAGWLRYNPARPAFAMTRDGLRLESITISVTRAGKELAGTDRVYQAKMLPHEAAELSLGLIETREDTKHFSVDKIELATVAGHEGYRADATYVDSQGLPKRLWMYGALITDHLCEFSYTGAESVYFERYLPVFKELVASARVVPR
jgi:hypothetical protein